jgi:hypothetical protein
MALINCNECGKEISNKAEACPHCGCPTKEVFIDNQIGGTKCQYCKKMVNPVVTNVGGGSCSVGSREKWTCPSCKRVIYSKGCFVATATYGDEDYIEVQFLRAYRDKHLQKNILGKYFVWSYYKISPYLAYVVQKSPILQTIFRRLLDKIVLVIEEKTSLKRDGFRTK